MRLAGGLEWERVCVYRRWYRVPSVWDSFGGSWGALHEVSPSSRNKLLLLLLFRVGGIETAGLMLNGEGL